MAISKPLLQEFDGKVKFLIYNFHEINSFFQGWTFGRLVRQEDHVRHLHVLLHGILNYKRFRLRSEIRWDDIIFKSISYRVFNLFCPKSIATIESNFFN
jgi:hypothetical protein